MAKKGKDADRYREIRNNKVARDYFVDEKIEAGIVLTGTEVKSLREGRAQLSESFVRFDNKSRPVLYHAHIAEYTFGTFYNHNPYRPRPLLLNKKEIIRLQVSLNSDGRALIPIRLYFKKALVKVELGLCRGKKLYDKREDLKEKALQKEMQQSSKHRIR